MNTSNRPNGIAPLPSAGNKGNKGGKVARAWQAVWDRLSATQYTEAIGLAWEIAPQFDLKPDTLLAHMHRMASEGVLARDHRPVTTEVIRMVGGKESRYRSTNRRTFYKIENGR